MYGGKGRKIPTQVVYTGDLNLDSEHSIFITDDEEVDPIRSFSEFDKNTYGGIIGDGNCEKRSMGTCAPAIGCAWTGEECASLSSVLDGSAPMNIYWEDRLQFSGMWKPKKSSHKHKSKKKTRKTSKKKKDSKKKSKRARKGSKKKTSRKHK